MVTHAPTSALAAADPIHALIKAHRAAYEAWNAAETILEAVPSREPAYAEAKSATHEASRREDVTFDAVIGASPTTLAGAIAKAEHLADINARLELDQDSRAARSLRAIAAGLHATSLATVRHPHPDAELLALGREFDEARAAWLATISANNEAMARFEREEARLKARGLDKWSAYTKAWEMPGVQAAYDAEGEAFLRLEPLNAAIKALSARTVEGLAVKARAVAVTRWTTGDYTTSLDKEWGDEHLRDLVEATCNLAGVDHLSQPRAQCA